MAQQNTFFSLERVIDRQPLTVSPQTLLPEVINLMHEGGHSCTLVNREDKAVEDNTSSNSSCVLVVEGDRLQGIFTNQDLVELVTMGTDVQNVTVAEMMTKNIVTWTPSEDEDVHAALTLLEEHRISHLPVVDDRNSLLGLVTARDIQREAIEILQLQVGQLANKESPQAKGDLITERELQIRLRQQQVVAELGQFALATKDFDDILNRVVDVVASTLEVEYCKVLELQSDNTLLLKAGVGWRDGLVGKAILGLKENQAGYTLQQSEPVIVDDLSAETRFKGPALLIDHRVISGMSVIIPDREKPYGALGTHTTRHRVFTRDDINFIQAIANIIAQANERQKVVSALQAREELFRVLTTSAPVGIFQADAKGDCQYVNPRWQEMTGLSLSEALGQGWVRALHPDDRDLVYTKWYEAAQTEREFSLEYRFKTPQDRIIWVTGRAVLLKDETGEAIGYLGTVTDISDRQRREAILTDIASGVTTQVGENFFNSLVQYLTQALNVEYALVCKLIEPNGKRVRVLAFYNHQKLVNLQNIEYDMVNTPCENVVGKQLCIYPKLVRELFPHDLFLQEIKAESYAGMPIFDSTGQALGLISIIHNQPLKDISLIAEVLRIFATRATAELERRQAESSLKESQERYSLVLQSSYSAIWDWDITTNEVFYAPRWKEILGWTDAELPNTFDAWSTKLHPEDRDRVMAALQDHLQHRVPFRIEYRLQKQDGGYCWVQAQGQAIWNSSDRAVRMAGSITDISTRKKRERIIKDIASGISIQVGDNFFHSLVEFLSKTLEVNFAFISRLIGSEVRQVETLAVYGNGENIDNFVYSLANAPCGNVIDRGLCLYPEAVRQLFPNIAPLEVMAAESYAGMPIFDADRNVIGLVAVVDNKPFTDTALIEEVLRIFATRASTELERQQAELALRQSEQKLKVIFDQSFQFIGLLEPNGNLIEANKPSLDYIGLTLADVKGKPFWSTPWWSTSSQVQQLIKQGIARAARGEFVRFEAEHPGTDGRLVTVDFSLTPIKDEAGRVVMLIPEGRNISDRKKVEADLQQSNQILQAISSIQTQYLSEAEPNVLFDEMLERLLSLTESEYGFIDEISIAADGNLSIEESYMKFRGRPCLKSQIFTNIAWNEETRAFYADNASKGIEFHNLETLFGAVMVTGKPVIVNSLSNESKTDDLPEGYPPLNAFLGVPFYKNSKMMGMVGIANRQGGYSEALVRYLKPFLDTCSRVIEVQQSDRQRRQAEAKIRQQAALLNVATDAILVRNLDNTILFWSRGAEKLYGWEETEALESDANELLYRSSTAHLSEIQQTVRERGEWQGELNQVTKSGKDIVVESRWTLVEDDRHNPQSYLVVNTDITEQKQLEAQFLRTQRMESLGTLAGGIAHDLNNILAPILGFSKLLPLKLPDADEQTKGFFKIMENNASRGTALVKQILTFSRGLEGEKGIVQIRHLVAEIRQIVRETFPKSIELVTDVPNNLWTVNADVNQLHQVLMNLSVNARDAMPDGGTLTIKAENTTVDPEYARLRLDATEGAYVSICVSDTGVGIPPHIIDRIFEPFFTTKEVGRGTGLGLSTVIGIVNSHGGFVNVVSDRNPTDRGTQFKVFLPASDTVVPEADETVELPVGNGELILVVDDEPAILEVTKVTLETSNYKVLTARDGIDAIAVYAKNQDIALVIMDLMMPLMDGKTTIRTLKKINPEIPIIAVSGLMNRQEILAQADGDISAYLDKPYSNDELLETIDRIVSC